MQISAERRAEQERLAGELGSIGFVLPGTLSERFLTCNHQGCHCHATPPRLHGPYWYLTRKVAGKTVTRMLSAEQVAEYQVLVGNSRRLRRLVRDLEALGLEVLEDDPRTPRRSR